MRFGRRLMVVGVVAACALGAAAVAGTPFGDAGRTPVTLAAGETLAAPDDAVVPAGAPVRARSGPGSRPGGGATPGAAATLR
ncbi:hypothetical protein V6U77_14655, partial [Micromonospora sp. CPCC 205546]|uniref:hypothetical protein n=1 Tax=Micromonospora sp. CPCC 205546 TaxID=3122397 RepID=UPI002FF0E328